MDCAASGAKSAGAPVCCVSGQSFRLPGVIGSQKQKISNLGDGNTNEHGAEYGTCERLLVRAKGGSVVARSGCYRTCKAKLKSHANLKSSTGNLLTRRF